MKRTALTPALAAFAAGRSISPLWVSPSGRAFYPIAGGSEDPADPADNPPADTPADPSSDLGFPAGTPVDQMASDQQAAYYRHQARKHEDRNKDLLKLTGGKYGDDLKADLDELATLRQSRMTDGEKAVEDAKRTAREDAQREFGPRMARIAFDAALAHIEDDDERSELIDTLNLNSVLTDEGDVDTAKVRRIVTKIAPADKGQGNERHDFGAGRRGVGAVKTGVSAGADLFAARKKSSTTNS